jgi:hypothetical protein
MCWQTGGHVRVWRCVCGGGGGGVWGDGVEDYVQKRRLWLGVPGAQVFDPMAMLYG